MGAAGDDGVEKKIGGGDGAGDVNTAAVLLDALQKTAMYGYHTKDWVSDLDCSSCDLSDRSLVGKKEQDDNKLRN